MVITSSYTCEVCLFLARRNIALYDDPLSYLNVSAGIHTLKLIVPEQMRDPYSLGECRTMWLHIRDANPYSTRTTLLGGEMFLVTNESKRLPARWHNARFPATQPISFALTRCLIKAGLW